MQQPASMSSFKNIIPLHLGAQQGHIAVVGMLLSRSTQQQHAKDWRGRSPLHLAAQNGHYEVGQPTNEAQNMNALVSDGLVAHRTRQQHQRHGSKRVGGPKVASLYMPAFSWTSTHYATRAGHTSLLRLFVDSSADVQVR